MITTVLAALTLAITALLTTSPAAAPAYVPDDSGTGTVLGRPAHGAELRVAFEGTFSPGETVSITIACPGADSMVVDDVANGSGSSDTPFTVPDGATGTCTITAVGLSSGSAGVAAFAVVAPDSPTSNPDDADGTDTADGLAATGASPVIGVWLGGGLLVMGGVALWILTQRRATNRRATHRN